MADSAEGTDWGLKAGLEIHQQLEGRKLFCDCPTTIRDDEPDFTLQRTLRASAGETGEVDIAARHEMAKQRYYVYEGHDPACCLVELDDEPPHPLNPDALATSLQMAKMLKAEVADQAHVMRKTVVDGSNTSGFQRTALIARNGTLAFPFGKVTIPTLCLEEDACRIIRQEQDHTVYRLDRLGIPLVEIATGPDLSTPEQVQEVAAHLGMLLRSTGKVKRGLGTIRQDVNVSIKGGARVEIKGVQDLRSIPLQVRNEMHRQRFLLELAGLQLPHDLPIIEVTKAFSHTKSRIIGKNHVLAIGLPGLQGVLGKEYAPGRRLGTELSDHAKMKGVKGLFHSDEHLDDYKISKKEQDTVRKILKLQDRDAFILIADQKERAQTALQAVIDRIQALPQGVPEEVRKANEDGTSSYLRPMPGAARMYPETDVSPIIPDPSSVKVPELIPDRIARYQKTYKISKDLAALVVRHVDDFEELARRFRHIAPSYLAEFFVTVPQELKKRYGLELDITEHADAVLDALEQGTISKDSVLDILAGLAQGKPFDPQTYAQASDAELKVFIDTLVKENPGLAPGAYMGDIMKHFHGKADGKKAMDLLRKKLK